MKTITCAVLLLAGIGQTPTYDPKPLSPAESLKALKPRPGFQAELMVAEPLVMDPIAFAFGADGKLWVVEMGDYPRGSDGKGKPGGRVKVLEDTRGTGKYDKATLFVDGLAYPTGVLPWRRGVLILAAPDLIYAEASSGSGPADTRKVLYTGFARGNPQHLVNGLVYGLDNWIYCANGDSGGEVTSTKTGQKVNIRGRDFRIQPDSGAIELQSGQTQFGRNRDDWNNWFGGNNSQPMWHYVLDDAYLKRNQHLASPDPRVYVPKVPGNAPVFPLAPILPRFNDYHTAGRFTSACSPIIYRDDLFGPAYAGAMFVSEPVHNLVHREVVSPKGLTFSSHRADDERQSEFLASTDNWFRPTTLQTGPDGALWIADMYRLVIEHPQWIPKEWQEKLDLRAGHDMGRIYRVFPVGVKPRAIPRLDKLSAAELVACLESPSGWQRDTAQRLLIERGGDAAILPLEKLFRDSKQPLARAHALYTLQGLGQLHPDYIAIALQDSHPGVRKHALRLVEPHLATWRHPSIPSLQLDGDDDPMVRQQFAYTLGFWPKHKDAGRLLGNIALGDPDDPYMLAAVFSSVNKDNFGGFAQQVMGVASKKPGNALMGKLVQLGVALGEEQGMAALLAAIARPARDGFAPGQYAALGAFLDALDQRGQTLAQAADKGSADFKASVAELAAVFAAARKTAGAAAADPATRRLALQLLARGLDEGERATDRKLLADLLTPQTPPELQTAAVETLAKTRDKQTPALLLAGWRRHGPAVRTQIVDALLGRLEWTAALLDALEAKTVAAAEIDAIRRQRLTEHKFDALRNRAVKLFAGASHADREKVLASYAEALTLKGDAKKGALVFKQSCAACHQLGGMGQPVGPDLAAEAGKPGQVLLIAIFDPNRAVEARYVSYSATLKNGQVLVGILASETSSGIELVAADGKKHAIARADLDDLVSTGKSLMPDGLEKDMTPAQTADLLAFIKAQRPPLARKTFPGNEPALVKANADGALELRAKNAEIYGPSLVWESPNGNLGYWQSGDDRAQWTVEVPTAGKYLVWLEWSCPAGNAGQAWALDAGERELLTARIKSTGGWETFHYSRIGEVTLTAGRQTLTIRAHGTLNGALMDFKTLKLVPVK